MTYLLSFCRYKILYIRFSHTIHITGDNKRKRPARDLTWTTVIPPNRRRGPEDIMSKPQKMSVEAEAATTEGDLWSLFFTSEMLRKIVEATNDKIEHEFLSKDYSDERMKKSPYIATTDEVFGTNFVISP
jgi:hypothetical protein